MGGKMKPFAEVTDLKGVWGFVPSAWPVDVALLEEAGLYVTRREEEDAVGDWLGL